MGTYGNPLTSGRPGSSYGNGLSRKEVTETTVTDPTLGNGDGTHDVDVSSVTALNGTDDVVGVSWSGSQKATVDSVSGNTVTVLFEEPDGAGNFTNTSDGSLSGTLTVEVLA
jgi:hypothetical protein